MAPVPFTCWPRATGHGGHVTNDWTVTDFAHLFRVQSGPNAIHMGQVCGREFQPDLDGHCTFRAAATMQARPNGELILMCHTHHANTDSYGDTDSKLKMAEFANDSCLPEEQTWRCLLCGGWPRIALVLFLGVLTSVARGRFSRFGVAPEVPITDSTKQRQ